MIKFIATLLALFSFSVSQAKEVKVGIILGFTGPIESLTPDMSAGATLAFNEASNSGELLNGSTISIVSADSTCIHSAAASSAFSSNPTTEQPCVNSSWVSRRS